MVSEKNVEIMDTEKAMEIIEEQVYKPQKSLIEKIGDCEQEIDRLRFENENLQKAVAETYATQLQIATLQKEKDDLRKDNCYLAQTVEKMTEEVEIIDREMVKHRKEIREQGQVLATLMIKEEVYQLTYEYLSRCLNKAEEDIQKLVENCRRLEDENTILSLEKDYVIEGYKEKIADLKKEMSAYLLLNGDKEIARLNKEMYFLKEELERAEIRKAQAVNSEEALKETIEVVSREYEVLKKVIMEKLPVQILINVDKALVEKNKELMEEKIKLLEEVEEYKDSISAMSGIVEVFREVLPNSTGTIFAL
jgi:chromosome segregation ATPase